LGSDLAETQAGTAISTPAYMSPEQAAGRLDLLSPASDVYSLGATLYCLLTGRAPFKGEDQGAVLRQVQQGDFPRPRQVRPRTPAPLEAVCLKAMALRPEDRYPTPLALAEDIEHWLADEPVSAYREPLPLRARRWARKHRPLVAGLTALLLTALLLGGGFGLWWKQQHDARVGAVQDHLDRAEQLRDAEQWDQARQALDRAEERLAGGGPARLRERLQRLRGELKLVRQLDEARMQWLAIGSNGKFDYAGADRAYTAVFAGQQLDPLGEDTVGTAERIARSPVRKQLAVALDDWAIVREHLRKGDAGHLLAVARRAEDDPWRQQLRDPDLRNNRAELEHLAQQELKRLANQKEGLTQPPVNLYILSLLLYRRGTADVAERFLREAQRHYPSDFWLTFELGSRLRSSSKEEAIGYYRAALALQPRNPAVHNNLGVLLRDQKKRPEAEAAFRKAIALQPDDADVWNNLGVMLDDQKKVVEAEAAFRKAIEVQPDHAMAWYNLGGLLRDQKQPAEAEAAYRQAIALQPDDAAAWYNLGNLLKEQKQPAEAEAAFRKAIEVQPDHAKAWTNLGLLLKEQKRPAEAEAAYRQAIEAQPDDAVVWNNLGGLLADQKRPAEAAYRKAIALQPDDAKAWYNLGNLLRTQKKVAEAEKAYRRAIALPPPDARPWINLGLLLEGQKKPAEAEAAYRQAIALQPDDAMVWSNLGVLLADQQKPAEAEAAFRKAVELQPDGATAWYNLGHHLQVQQKPAEAEAAYRKVIALRPDLAEAHCNLGHLLRTQGRFTEALASFQRGHELGSRNPAWPYPSAGWVRQAERLVELEGKLPALLKGEAKPAGAAEQIELARLCQQHKQLYAAAARFYRDAFAAEPKRAEDLRSGNRYNAACAAVLAGCGQGKDADPLDEKERTALREQALAWLRADLAAWASRLKYDPELAPAGVRQTMQHWQKDTDLAGVRDADALAKLPEAERQQWQKLWDDVEALRQRAAAPK
jgi:Tfp pilus assembly protein PilF